MSKSILVIDTPKNCNQCDLHYAVQVNARCLEMCPLQVEGLNNIYGDLPDGCRLRPLPQKKEVEVNKIDDIMHTEYSIEDIYTNKYIADIRLATDKLIALGYNMCLDEILGEENVNKM